MQSRHEPQDFPLYEQMGSFSLNHSGAAEAMFEELASVKKTTSLASPLRETGVGEVPRTGDLGGENIWWKETRAEPSGPTLATPVLASLPPSEESFSAFLPDPRIVTHFRLRL